MTALATHPVPGPAGGPSRVLALLESTPVDVDGIVDHLELLQDVLRGDYGGRDGVTRFHRFYLRITRDVRAQLDDAGVVDKDFLARLWAEFAGRYLQVLRADARGAAVPRAWAVLLDRRARRRSHPVEHAVLGITAHVNLDLAPAVVRACTVLGRSAPGAGGHADFRALHDTVAAHTRRLVDCGSDAVADGIGVVLSQEAVWRQALGLWEHRSRPTEYERELDALDRRTALLGRGLLTPGALT